MLLVSVAVFMPWQIYIFSKFPKEAAFEYAYNSKHIFDSVEGHGGSPWFHVDHLNYYFTPLFYVLFPLSIIFLIRKQYAWKAATLLGWILVPLIFFGFVKTKMVAFCLFIYPAVALSIGYGINELAMTKSKLKILILTPVFVFIGWVGINTVNFLQLDSNHVADNEYNRIMLSRIKTIKEESEKKRERPVVVFNTPDYIEWMFYVKDCSAAYHYSADSSTVSDLKQKGYDVFILNPGAGYVLQ